jgi:hypothetical protein
MSSALKYAMLCLAGLVAACGDDGSDPAAPGSTDLPPPAAASGLPSGGRQNALAAPAIVLSTHALYYCYTPGGNRMCVILKRTLRVTSSSTTALKWTASKNQPWIVVSPAGGTTPTSVTVSVDPAKLPPWTYAFGMVTISAAGASNSPQTIRVEKNPVGRSLNPPALAFSDSAIGFCFNPTSTRACIKLEEHVQFTSTRAPLTWKAVSGQPWIVVRPTSATTPTDVRVFVDFDKLPPRNGALSVSGWITVSAAGASNSPRTIPVKLQYYSQPLPQ